MYHTNADDMDERIVPWRPRWDEFIDRLSGPDACNFNADTWTCFGDTRSAEKVMADMGLEPAWIYESLRYFRKQDAYCDCEIVLKVGRRPRDWTHSTN
jgi:hypothetical protein